MTPGHAGCVSPRKNATKTERHGRSHKVFFAHAREHVKDYPVLETPSNDCVETWSDSVAYVRLKQEISGRHIAEVSREHKDR
jgi:hypothetical protein